MIDSSDISVVVQGPVLKASSGANITRDVCKSIRTHLPHAEIILSTWKDCDVNNLDFDNVIISDNIDAPKIRMPYTGDLKLYSINHQIITSLSGIRIAKKKYVLKLRSDLSLTGTGFLKYFDCYNEYPQEKEFSEWRVFSKRIITLPTYNILKEYGLPFNVCDWFFFGLKEDILFLFDIPLVDTNNLKIRKEEIYPRIEDNFGAEQVIWLECLRKKRSIKIKNAFDKTESLCRDFEISLANNFVPISAKQANVHSLSYGVGAYAVSPCFSRGMYTLEEWEHLYNKYGGGSIHVKYRSAEHLLSFLYRTKENICKRSKLISKVYYTLSKKLNKKRLK